MIVQKYKRGQIWWMRDNSPEPKEHLQSGTRPVIIVSNDAANRFSNNLTIIPCTTAEKKDLPTHVKLQINGDSLALCEMITTISNTNIMSYIGTCDKELLEKIENCIRIALGFTEPNSTITGIIKHNLVPTTEKITPIFEDTSPLEEKLSTRKAYEGVGRKGYQKYTKEDMIRFINDCENHTIEWVTKKYECSSEKAASNKLYRFRKFLKGNP